MTELRFAQRLIKHLPDNTGETAHISYVWFHQFKQLLAQRLEGDQREFVQNAKKKTERLGAGKA